MNVQADMPGANLLVPREQFSKLVSLTICVLIALAYAVATAGVVPALRQDWAPPQYWMDWHQPLLGAQGWSSIGIGSATTYYISTYLITIPIAAASALMGGNAALFLLLWGVGLVCALGARAIAIDAGCGLVGIIAAATFAVLNPWVYSKLVAGHVFMILAYGATMWFVRAALSSKPDATVLTMASLLMLQQIQFFFVALLMFVPLVIVRRTWKPAALALFVWLPVIIGIIWDANTLRAMPFILEWERGQSVQPLSAVELGGYFAGYGAIFGGVFATPALLTAFLAIVALRSLNRRNIVIACGIALALLLAMGVHGPASPIFSWAVEHLRPIALFRELFDLLAYASIGYVMLAATTCGRRPLLQWLWLAASLLLPIAWLLSPPGRFWVPEAAIPVPSIRIEPNTRYALTPAYQPMRFDGRGSGADPDSYPRENNFTPLNEYLSGYPVNSALSSFLLNGDRHELEVLSVSTIVERPWLESDMAALKWQWALPFRGFPKRERYRVIHLDPYPELSLLEASRRPARETGGLLTTAAPNRQTAAARGWVDARLAFAERPDLSQPYGGALTTNSRSELNVRNGVPALVFVSGSLRSADGAVLTGSTAGYSWVLIPRSVHAVRCSGLCVVAGQGTPAPLASFSEARRGSAVAFRQILPWLATATVPAGPAETIRYNVSFAKPWAAFLQGNRLQHYRLYDIVNGWSLPERSAPESLVLVHLVSLAQFATELLILAVLVGLAIRMISVRLRRRRSPPAGAPT